MRNRNMTQQLNTQGRGIKSAFNNHHICRTDRDTSLAINHLQKTQNPHQPEEPQGHPQKKKKRKRKERHQDIPKGDRSTRMMQRNLLLRRLQIAIHLALR